MRTDESHSFAELLKRHRLAAGLSQEELAGRAGLSPRGVSDLERGARMNPRPATVRLLADALGLTDDERAAFHVAALGNTSPVRLAGPAITLPPGESRSAGERDAPALPSGTVTFLFTDIEGSTRLLHQLGERYAEVLGRQQRILRAAFAAHGGNEVDTQGDSFFAAFPTAREAIACAVKAQRQLAAEAWPEDVQVRVRMGLHTGAPQLVGTRYVGVDVHRAARIAAAGHGGQILLSEATVGLVRAELPDSVTVRDLGAHRLKDLQQAERIWQVVLPDLPDLPMDFPPLRALDARPHNLPVQPTALLGRKREVAAVCALLRRDDVRLVTLTGPGGIGKTRLSVQVAAEVLDAFPDGVWQVRLSRLTDPALVLPTVAHMLGLKESGAVSLAEVLRAYLRDKRLLLLLDNFEQVAEAAPDVAALLEECVGVKALVTSRVALRLRGEREYMLRPLALPDPAHLPPPGRLSQYAAVALFIERAQAAQADFAVTNANAPAVAEICARLDGLPLAIELAAARVKLLPPPALLKRLEHALPLLVGGARDVDERQQTMRATLQWSYELLSSEEQRLFRRLGVFVGGCTLEAAEAVCVAPEGAEQLGIDVLEGLGRLVDQSLIQQHEEGGEPQFGMLHVVREYALEELEARGHKEADAVRQAHATCFLALAERAEPELFGPGAETRRDQLEREHDNLRAALGWAREQVEGDMGMRLVAALVWFWIRRGHLREGRTWAEGMLALGTGPGASGSAEGGNAGIVGTAHVPPGEGTRARALVAAGILAILQGDYAAAEPWLEQGLALGRAAGDLLTAARALDRLGMISSDRGDTPRGVALMEEGLALMREAGDLWGIAATLSNLGTEACFQGDLELAAAYLAEALPPAREQGDRAQIAVVLSNVANVARKRGDLAQAEELAREALALYWQRRDPRRCAEGLENVACVAAAAGQGTQAARLLGAAAAVRETLGNPQAEKDRADIEQAIAGARVATGEQAWNAAFEAGRALSLEEAIAEALGEDVGAVESGR